MSDTTDETFAPSAGSSFATTSWSSSDAAGLLPSHTSAKRVARAWDRQPHQPHTSSAAIARAGQGTRKVWRRVRMPVFGSGTGDAARSAIASMGAWGAKGMSPKKAVKKLCLQNDYGREWKMTEWEGVKGGHTRKTASRPPIVLRSGTVLDPDFEVDEATMRHNTTDDDDEMDNEEDENNEEIAAKPDHIKILPDTNADIASPENEWEDIDSEDDGSETAAEGDAHVQNMDEVCGIFSCNSDQEIITKAPSVEDDEDISPTREAIDSPFSEQDVSSPAKAAPEIPTLQIPEQTSRCTSAPPTETATREERTRPRISDDTAILHAFLSRAAASKKPAIARRESLTNRRDSDMVRLALASPAKPEVLAELDANSPLPHKVIRLDANENTCAAEKFKSPSKAEMEATDEDQRPTRRSSRSRAKPSLLLDQMTGSIKAAPSKITIRGPMDTVSLKRTEVQELAAQTRSNTRKNKGQAVMPLVRLTKLAGEKSMDEAVPDTESDTNGQGKNVHWDETLAYYSKAPDVVGEDDAAPSGSQEEAATAATTGEAPSSPGKPRPARRVRTVKPEPQASTAQPAGDVAAPAPKSAPPKRRSRIATPAKGLLSRTALLPDDVVAPAAEADAPKPLPTTAAAAALAPGKKPAPPRSLPTPKRAATAHSQAKPGVPAPPPASPEKKAAGPPQLPQQPKLQGIPVFAPRLAVVPSGLSFEDALARDGQVARRSVAPVAAAGGDAAAAPGLSSPAKRRRKAVVPQRDGEEALPAPAVGLSSPAKRRRGVAY